MTDAFIKICELAVPDFYPLSQIDDLFECWIQ